MAAIFEHRSSKYNSSLWIGKYKNLHNLPHWHWEQELIACRDGNAELMLEGISYTLSSGMAAFCPAEAVHRITAEENATVIVVQLAPELLSFTQKSICLQNPVFPDQYGAFDRMNAILQEMKEQKPFFAPKAEATMVELCIDIFRREPWGCRSQSQGKNIAQYRELLSCVQKDLEFITFSEAAARMHMSEAYFSRFFKNQAGMTFSDYLNLRKVDAAIGILKSEPQTSASDIALRCGFNTLRNFNRVFRKVTGYSPKQLPEHYTLHLRQYAVSTGKSDPTLSESILIP